MTAALPLIASRLFNQPLAVHPGKAAAILDAIGGRVLGVEIMIEGAEPVHHVVVEQGKPSMGRLGDPLGRRLQDNKIDALYRVGAVGVIPIEGSLIHKGKWLGASSGETSYEGIQSRIRQAMDDPSIRGVVFEVDSFGGEVAGAFDTAAMIRQLSAKKQTIAILTDFALSAGYLLASGARQIVMPPSGRAGSIGVITMHADYSKVVEKSGVKITILSAGKHKAEGNPYEPLPDDVATRIQADLESARLLFAEAVAEGRGKRMSVDAAMATEADDFRGADALALGLVDGIDHPNELFDAFVGEVGKTASRSFFMKGPTVMNAAAIAAARAAGTETFSLAQMEASLASGHAEGHKAGRTEGFTAGLTEGHASGIKVGAKGAQDRIKAILGSKEAEGRTEQAQMFAFDTDIAPETATALLAKAPVAVAPAAGAGASAALLAEMAALQQPNIGADRPSAGNGAGGVSKFDEAAETARRLLGKKN